jgi:nucleotide-binding universal stress UspA family protein
MIPNRIVVATDGSPAAKAAEALAADLAGMMSPSRAVEVVVITVVHDVGYVTEPDPQTPDLSEADVVERVSLEGAKHIRALLAELPSGTSVKVEEKVLESPHPGLAPNPGLAIVAEAHATGTCSLIVLGNRGHGGIAEALLGSVSQYVVREAHCPVLIARA